MSFTYTGLPQYPKAEYFYKIFYKLKWHKVKKQITIDLHGKKNWEHSQTPKNNLS